MCIIIDSDRLGIFWSKPINEDAQPIHNWLNGNGMLVYTTGSKFSNELSPSAKIKFADLVRRGVARLVSQEKVSEKVNELEHSELELKSEDIHVIALALVSGARLLFTGDKNLMHDFKNKDIINHPRGKIYSGMNNRSLLTNIVCTN